MQNHHEGCCKHTEHQHEGCCKGEGHHHEGRHNEHHAGCCKGEEHRHEGCNKEHHHEQGCGHRHGRSGGRRQRFFGHGELRLVILDILTRDASHGYELIKAIETLTQGNYTPSPGVVYPTLDFLQDQELITISDEEGGRKQILRSQPRASSGWMKTVSIWNISTNVLKPAAWVLNYARTRR